VNTSLIREMSDPDMDLDRIRSLLEDARRREIMLDAEGLAFAFQNTLEALAARLREAPDDLAQLNRLEAAARLAKAAPFEVNLWNLQNAFYDLRRDHSGTVRARADAGETRARTWLETFHALAEHVGVAVD
jgi:hypothetical protein